MSKIHNKSVVIGLTGPSGAGKTSIAKIMEEYGFFVIDADKLARLIMQPNTECLNKLSDYFGKSILKNNASLNRATLAEIAFSCEKNTKKLNEITLPYINKLIKQNIAIAQEKSFKFIIIDAPLLFESNVNLLCDTVVSVMADKNTCLNRILKRDSISKALAEMRLEAQINQDYLKKNSDYILDGNLDPSEIRKECLILINKLMEEFT